MKKDNEPIKRTRMSRDDMAEAVRMWKANDLGLDQYLTDHGITHIGKWKQNARDRYGVAAPATVKVDGPIRIETPEANRVQVAEVPEIIDGVTKEITVHEADMFEVPEGMVPLHMLKHPVKVNIVKDEPKITKPPVTKPVVYDGMIIREVEGAFGRYRYSDIGTVEYIDFESTDQMDVLSLSIGQWRNFREEQRKAARILGVEL